MTDQPARTEAGFKERTRLSAARERLREAVAPLDRTETVPLSAADGRVLAEPVDAGRDVPHYERAAMDGWAVRAEDTYGASDRSPAVLRGAEGRVGPGEAVRVHTGSELPEGADGVVMVESTERVGRSTDGATGDAGSAVGDDVEVFEAVGEGENVAPVGEDVTAGQRLHEPGHRLRPSDLGLLKSVGVDELEVVARPTVGVVPTGEELVQADPDPGEVVETNGLTVSGLVERWGGRAAYRAVVTDDEDALRAAVQRDLTKDVVVTTGGSSVGQRDLMPEVVDDLGEMLVHGVALKPGHPVGVGVVEDTPVLVLPGYPVSCIVTAVQLLRPLLAWLRGTEPSPIPSVEATLERKISSEPGVRSFARVSLEDADGDASSDGNAPARTATPTRSSGAGVLSSVALADGWVEVPESREGIPAGETVRVQDWEWSA